MKTGKFDKERGKFLANLKGDRETGDYEAVSYLDEDRARRALGEADGFVEEAENFLRRIGACTLI